MRVEPEAEAVQRLSAILSPGETLLWADRPDPTARRRRSATVFASAVAVLLAGVAILATQTPLGGPIGQPIDGGASALLAIAAAIATLAAGSTLYNGDFLQPDDAYGLTESRLIIMHRDAAGISEIPVSAAIAIGGAHALDKAARGDLEIVVGDSGDTLELIDIREPALVAEALRRKFRRLNEDPK